MDKSFKTTRVIGDYQKIYVDEEHGLFRLVSFNDETSINSEMCSGAMKDVNSVYIEAKKILEEIKVCNKHHKPLSFNPPCYAVSFDFIVTIFFIGEELTKYVFKLNKRPVSVEQPTLIVLKNKEEVAEIISQRYYSGYGYKDTNEEKVRNTDDFKKYLRFSKLIYMCFPNCTSSEVDVDHCLWCGSELKREPFICSCCCGINRPGA